MLTYYFVDSFGQLIVAYASFCCIKVRIALLIGTIPRLHLSKQL